MSNSEEEVLRPLYTPAFNTPVSPKTDLLTTTMCQPIFAKLTYQAPIDGLRAVAVLSVLLFHLGISILPGGFVGVDIFFVISGYLITAILLHEMQTGSFSFAAFYRRRALRILPPLLVMLGVVLLVAVAVMLPSEVRATGRSVVAALVFGSNVHFWQSFDYFTPDAKEDPLLHTWSLGVEEQFYILVPVVLWLWFCGCVFGLPRLGLCRFLSARSWCLLA
jgi:peptidoglycan/LPS O-acetylase OafA/YrhL